MEIKEVAILRVVKATRMSMRMAKDMQALMVDKARTWADADGLDRAEEPALFALANAGTPATDAQVFGSDVALTVCHGCGIGYVRRLKDVVLVPVAHSRHIPAFPNVGGHIGIAAVCGLKYGNVGSGTVHVIVDVEAVIVAQADHVRPENPRIA